MAIVNRLATKAARQRCIGQLLETSEIESQAELRQLLADRGFAVTQATLSRDLDELGAVKVAEEIDQVVYRLPTDGAGPEELATDTAAAARIRLERALVDLLGTIDYSANIVVLRTRPGAAQYLASLLDHSALPELLGTVAGDDTVLLVSRDPQGGERLSDFIAALGGRRSRQPIKGGE